MGINIAAVCGNAYTKRAILLAKRAKAGNAEIAEIEQERRELKSNRRPQRLILRFASPGEGEEPGRANKYRAEYAIQSDLILRLSKGSE